MAAASHIVGIDLGTTNTVVARADLADGRPVICPMAQLVGEGEIASRDLLPSVLFAPMPDEPIVDRWDDAPFVVGAYARARGQRTPGRAITSPKSWLAHAAIDRLAPTLPWGADPTDSTLPRVSPVEASRRILQHVRRAYDREYPETPLTSADIVLTVPASFDEVARELTVRAATEAGLRVRLLEEPLAAFHDYVGQCGTGRLGTLARELGRDAFVLVCDVGGGTTDLTLVRARLEDGKVRLERVAVGRHLLLGGDNMDLALAHAVEPRLIAPHERLDPARFSELVLSCRAAKERLLADGAPEQMPIRLLSRGSALVGSTLSASLTRADVQALLVEGFFPAVDEGAKPAPARSGFVGFGLSYERDAAITRHVAAFLKRHLPESSGPDAVLLNGGVFRAPAIRTRFLESLARGASQGCAELPAPEPDLAVARGAVAFGLSVSGRGTRVGGGSARGYYVGLGAAAGDLRAICVVPRGATEGERHVVTVPGLSLLVGEPARFDLFSADSAQHAPGVIVDVSDGLEMLPSMTASFGAAADTAEKRVDVHLEGELTAVGTLDVACVENADADRVPRRFRLAFDLRGTPRPSRPPASVRPVESKTEAAREALLRVFGKGRTDVEQREARHLVRELERILGERATWTTETSRALYDAIIVESKARRRSVEHERAFWMVAGFCLRPGFGHPLDEKRIARVVPLFAELTIFGDEARTWQQFWIAWRRLAGGLGEPAQCAVRDLLDPFLSTDGAKPKKKKGVKPQAEDEMLELAASLENVPASRRADLGRWILERTWTNRDPRLWKALGRVGARVPTYGSAHHVVLVSTVEKWIDHALREKWTDTPAAGAAAAQMARVTSDRARDVAESLRRDVAKRLEASGAPSEWRRAVLEFVPLDDAERAEFFGDSLPVGLELRVVNLS